ncbi:MAG: hypothetical protein KAI79_12735 [Bacteroidales bacterium]|nr:hypothetical protein [Bacteroidales bacterium]
MNNNQKIIWKCIPVVTTAADGVELKGEIHYWAKDYNVCLKEPFEVKGCGSHLMYAIPVRFVTDEEPRQGVKDVHLIPRAKETLLSLYERKE